jgi:hypothetical protein
MPASVHACLCACLPLCMPASVHACLCACLPLCMPASFCLLHAALSLLPRCAGPSGVPAPSCAPRRLAASHACLVFFTTDGVRTAAGRDGGALSGAAGRRREHSTGGAVCLLPGGQRRERGLHVPRHATPGPASPPPLAARGFLPHLLHSSAHTTCLQRPSCSGLMVREPKASGPGRPVPRLSPRLLFRALRSRSPPAPWVGVNWAGAVGSGSTRHRPPHQRACRVTPVSDACFRRSRPRALLGVTRARLGPLSAVAARAAGRQESAHLASARANRIRYGFSQMDAGAPESAGWSRSRPRTALAVLSAMPVLKGMP